MTLFAVFLGGTVYSSNKRRGWCLRCCYLTSASWLMHPALGRRATLIVRRSQQPRCGARQPCTTSSRRAAARPTMRSSTTWTSSGKG